MSKNLSPNKKYDYQVLDDSTLMITQYYGKDAELETPRKIGHMNVSRIGNRAFSGCNTLKQVTISNGVTCIENHAFTDCEQLTSVMIPDTVKSIGESLFDDCPQLEKITVANCSGTCYELDIKRIKYNDRTRARNYTCPYCGVKIMPEQVLFWETQRASYKDTVRSDFLRHHGVHVWSGFFNRIYYRTKLGINVVLEDENGFPTAIEDSINNAIEPEYIHIPKIRPDHNSRIGKAFDLDLSDDTFDIDDDFYDRDEDRENNDTFDFDTEDFEESLVSFSKKTDFGVHTITQRACPFCHCELPKQFGTLDTYHIAVWGGNASGKTAYLLSLFQQLNTQLKTNDLGKIELENESTAYISALLERYERFETTNATTIDDVLPIVYHL